EGTVAGLDPNPGMLAVAREVAPADASIRWHEAPAEEIPLPDDSFDLALCGMGLQFFSDRPAALGEIRRVLVPGGRVVANVPGPTPPPLAAMAEALTDHIGPESGSFVRAVFSLHDPDELRALVTGAGFRDAEVRSAPRTLSLPA
ncbi:MAG: methyltransferase domain-containing protein, partial [Gemmatimonadetes bacterium]|nr:methyltransferase domain-containing protein [Gemmatimonadota bacterium]NIR78855.1 methyltransferase domain-containing protein [Gemmatimonadota bacterium]NIT87492.1 methyltransferase domain-containing protein [Gemmatimonadota bacterium]NIU31356.1 methyltransferase domain-containing protein [Gemmatimonadota bacterium]NIU36040.1 methyltransferase domain-containing protein [Gemmatimonadota bacterium]